MATVKQVMEEEKGVAEVETEGGCEGVEVFTCSLKMCGCFWEASVISPHSSDLLTAPRRETKVGQS